MIAKSPESFLFYTRSQCPLCEEMLLDIGPYAQHYGFALDIVDIDRDPELVELYGHKVPVLVRPHEDEDFEVCHFYLDEQALLNALGEPAPDESAEGASGTSLRNAGVYDRIYALVMKIPPGHVATYGQIAALEGRATARQVGYALAALPDDRNVPWQRVVNRAGRVSDRSGGGDSGQRRLLSDEGVLFDARGRLRFSQCGWNGPDYEWLTDNGFEPAAAPDDR